MIVWCKQGKRMIRGEIVQISNGTDIFVTWPEIGVYMARENPAEFLPEPVEEKDEELDLDGLYEEAEAASD